MRHTGMKVYKASRKGYIKFMFIGFMLLPIVIFFFDQDTFTQNPFILLPLLSPIIIILWLYLDTSYKIQNHELIYRSGILRGKIDISAIREIIKGKTMWVGIKPALARGGLIIRFNKYDEIYIAPEKNDQMISDLLEINPEIKIIENH